jgi:multiple sugar transport system substrate-binding protein
LARFGIIRKKVRREKMFKGKNRWFILTLLLFVFLAACGGSEDAAQDEAESAVEEGAEVAPAADETAEVNLWIFEGEEEFLPRLEEEFEAQNPDIDLRITEIPEGDYVTKIDTALAAGDPPEIGFIYERRWVKADRVLSVQEALEAEGIDVSEFNQGPMGAACLVEDDVYCMGTYSGGMVLFYNKDMFDEAGLPYPSTTEAMSMEEYAEIAALLSNDAEEIQDKVWGGTSDIMLYWSDPAYIFSEDGRTAVVDDEATINAHQILADMIAAGHAPSPSDFDLFGDAAMAAQGQQAMWIIDNIVGIESLEAVGDINWGVAPVPVESAGDSPWVSSWTDAFGVFADSDNPEAAKKFITFLATDGNRLRAEIGGIPLNLAIADDMNWAGDSEGRQELLEVMQFGRQGVFVPNFWDVIDPMWDAWDTLVEEGGSAQEYFDEAAEYVQENLDQAWETFESIE